MVLRRSQKRPPHVTQRLLDARLGVGGHQAGFPGQGSGKHRLVLHENLIDFVPEGKETVSLGDIHLFLCVGQTEPFVSRASHGRCREDGGRFLPGVCNVGGERAYDRIHHSRNVHVQ